MLREPHGGDVYRHPNVLDLSVNLNPLGAPARVLAAVKKSVEEIGNYPSIDQTELKEAIAASEGVTARQVVLGNGAAELIYMLVQARRPRRALLPVPTFSEYERALDSVNCAVEYYRMKKENGYTLDESFVERIREGCDIVFLCNPNNPTGRLVTSEILKKIRHRCREIGAFLVVDECFLDFTDDPAAYSVVNRIPRDRNLLVLKSFTKTFAIPGLRLGYALAGNRELVKRMEEIVQPWNISVPAQRAGLAACREKTHVKKARKLIGEERGRLSAALAASGFEVFPSEANFILFRGKSDLAERLLKEGILIRDCANFEGLTRGFFRVAVRGREENEKLIAAIRRAAEQKKEE